MKQKIKTMGQSLFCSPLLIGLVSFSLLLVSCSREPKEQGKYEMPTFSKVKYIDSEMLNNDVEVNNAMDICCIGSHIAVLSLTKGMWIHLYSKESGIYEGSLLADSTDIEWPRQMRYDAANHILSISDLRKPSIVTYDFLESTLELRKTNEYFFPQRHLQGSLGFMLPNEQFLVESIVLDEKQTWLTLYNNGNEIIAGNNDHPQDDMMKSAMWDNSRSSVSPSGKHYAIGTLFGGILRLYDIGDNSIGRKYEGLFIEPKGLPDGFNFSPTEETTLGFCDVLATDDKVFGLIINSTKEEGSSIATWSWDGNPLALYETGNFALHICEDPADNSLIYAFSFDKDHKFVLEKYSIK